MRMLVVISALVALALPHVARAQGLSTAEREAFGRSVAACWNVQQDAVAVTLGFTLDRAGRPVMQSIRLQGRRTGEDAAVVAAFSAAKRAVLRCGAVGFDLPVEKYQQWRNIELTFDPERMVLR